VTTALDEYETREVEILIARQYGASCHVPGHRYFSPGYTLIAFQSAGETWRNWTKTGDPLIQNGANSVT